MIPSLPFFAPAFLCSCFSRLTTRIHQEKGNSLIGLRSGISECSDALRRCLGPGRSVSDIRHTQTVKTPYLRPDTWLYDRDQDRRQRNTTNDFQTAAVLSKIYNRQKLLQTTVYNNEFPIPETSFAAPTNSLHNNT